MTDNPVVSGQEGCVNDVVIDTAPEVDVIVTVDRPVGPNELEQDLPETRIEPAINEEVDDSVDDHEQVDNVWRADEPNGWIKLNSASQLSIHIEQLVQIDQDSRQIGQEESANNKY